MFSFACLVLLRIKRDFLFLQGGNPHLGDFDSCFSPVSLSASQLNGISAPLPHCSPPWDRDYTMCLWQGSELACLAQPHILLLKLKERHMQDEDLILVTCHKEYHINLHSKSDWFCGTLSTIQAKLVSGTVTFPLTTVVCSEQTSPVLSIYSNSGIYILELYIHTCIDNLYLNYITTLRTNLRQTTVWHKLKTTCY